MAIRAQRIDPKISTQESNTAVGRALAKASENLSPEEIAARSYQLWQERGCPIGSPEVDWFQAEGELLDRQSTSTARR